MDFSTFFVQAFEKDLNFNTVECPELIAQHFSVVKTLLTRKGPKIRLNEQPANHRKESTNILTIANENPRLSNLGIRALLRKRYGIVVGRVQKIRIV